MTITSDSSTFTAGQQVRLRITVADAAATRWGFELSPRRADSPGTAYGSIAAADATSQILTSGSLQYAIQTSAGTRTGQASAASWDVVWTAPAELSGGAVIFYAVGLACNNNGSDSGDRTYTATATLQPAATAPAVTGVVKALPQFVFGGGWSTSIYFGNPGETARTVQLKFFAEDGSPLTVPAVGGATKTLDLPSHGAASIEAPDTGALTAGWVQVTIPEGVTGYGVFRQTAPGAAVQEAVVPISSTASSAATLVFDETAFTTALALLNPAAEPATVSLTARDETGAILGTAAIPLAAGARTTLTLRGRPELTAVLGKRGLIECSVSSGTLGVLGLRFADAAFTSIPAAER